LLAERLELGLTFIDVAVRNRGLDFCWLWNRGRGRLKGREALLGDG
jgi:hypothetical protein